MTSDENKAFIRRFYELLNEDNVKALADVIEPDFQLHFDGMPTLDGPSTIGFFGAFLGAFPGIQHTVHDQIAEGDEVATRISVRGTHRGEFMGMPPTGREITIGAMNIHRFANGKIAEQWVNSDGLGMLQQLGAFPPPS